MGFGYGMSCPKCQKTFELFFSVGMMYPSTYSDALKRARSGKLGEEYKQFFKEHPNPDGAISVNKIVLVCNACGNIENRSSYSLFTRLPDRTPHQKSQSLYSILSGEPDRDYISPKELNDDYELYAYYPHKCSKCGEAMTTISTDDIMHADTNQPCKYLKCPDCKVELVYSDCINWD